MQTENVKDKRFYQFTSIVFCQEWNKMSNDNVLLNEMTHDPSKYQVSRNLVQYFSVKILPGIKKWLNLKKYWF